MRALLLAGILIASPSPTPEMWTAVIIMAPGVEAYGVAETKAEAESRVRMYLKLNSLRDYSEAKVTFFPGPRKPMLYEGSTICATVTPSATPTECPCQKISVGEMPKYRVVRQGER